MNILPRSAWTSTPNKRSGRPILGQLESLTGHWPAVNGQLLGLSQEQVAQQLRNYWTLHTRGNGWIDIGYNYAVDGSGRIWELTGMNQGAHAGVDKGNKTSCALLFVIGTGEQPNQAMIDAATEFYAWVRSKQSKVKGFKGHRDWKPTQCPGNPIYTLIQRGTFQGGAVTGGPMPGPPALSAPAYPLPQGYYFGPKSGPNRSVSGYYQKRHNGETGHDGLAAWQQRMQERGWAISVDGLYGNQTGRVAFAFQTEKGLDPDALIGIDTWNAAWQSPVT